MDEGSVGVDGAERTILDRYVEFGKQVEGATFSNIGHPE